MVFYNYELSASKDLAKEDGAYETYPGSPVSKGVFQFDMWDVKPTARWEWDLLKDEVKKYGVRNSLLLAPMPTASTAQILGNNECFEPYTSNIYSRRTLSGEFAVVNKHLLRDLVKLNLWNDSLKNKLIAANGSVQEIDEVPDNLKELYKTAWEISQKVIIEMSADRGAYIDQSQSLNIFMENANFIRQIKQFDLSIPFDELVDNLTNIKFSPSVLVRKDLSDRLSENDLKLEQITRYQNAMQLNRDKDIFKELILQLDKLYKGVFKLKERIIDNKSKEILNNFPKNEEKESIISQEYELLKDYKEKGYLLISNSEENEMLIDSHNDLVDEETGDVISIGIDKNQTYIISSSDEQTERWRSYGFLDEKPTDIEEDIFDDTDLFEDAFEELGDEFLENLEELDIDELI